jgi:phosphoribosylglycinamide formyltransferase 1
VSQPKRRIAILISGRGSNLQAFIDAIANGDMEARISLVLSNNPEAAGLQRAAAAGIATAAVDHRDYASREDFDAALVDTINQHGADVVLLAGFMRILTPVFIDAYAGRLLNIHPSLLPKYPGLNTHQRALDAGDTEAGVTVHFVTAELDGGPPIVQARVAIKAGDNADTLAARVLTQEHRIYPLAANWLLQGRLKLTEHGVKLDDNLVSATGINYEIGNA